MSHQQKIPGYTPYDNPKLGTFRITTDEYSFPNGWGIREEDYKIIGETDLHYVYRLQNSGVKILAKWLSSAISYCRLGYTNHGLYGGNQAANLKCFNNHPKHANMELQLLKKAIFDDGKEMEFQPKPLEYAIATDSPREKMLKRSNYIKQFKRFTHSVFDQIDSQFILEYAEAELHMECTECFETHLESCEDDELLAEAKARGLIYGYPENILNADLL